MRCVTEVPQTEGRHYPDCGACRMHEHDEAYLPRGRFGGHLLGRDADQQSQSRPRGDPHLCTFAAPAEEATASASAAKASQGSTPYASWAVQSCSWHPSLLHKVAKVVQQWDGGTQPQCVMGKTLHLKAAKEKWP